jgi:hypothetical protein
VQQEEGGEEERRKQMSGKFRAKANKAMEKYVAKEKADVGGLGAKLLGKKGVAKVQEDLLKKEGDRRRNSLGKMVAKMRAGKGKKKGGK